MKYWIGLGLGIVMSFQMSWAQKFGFVDADFVLKKLQSYEKAQANIQESAIRWQADIDKKFTTVENKRAEYLAEEVLLTEEMKLEKQAEIKKLSEEAREYQKKVFGYQGLFYTRQQELLKPAMEELYKAIEKVARKNKVQVILSNSGGLTILYTEQRHDYTEEVMKELGLLEEEKAPEANPNNKQPNNNVKTPENKRN
ncbi:MAG: OmpH family outer membrane protein [Microscillaceae bacterium]|jgi:outer membrane protein|nr:OmpH family outer membrane protein [Microscillaceae bacterium]